jgi:hypothetical protein
MMQMLSAGGWPVFDPKESFYPAFEHPANMSGDPLPKDAAGILKWLISVVPVPPEWVIPPKVRGTIFLTRNPVEQARSHLKWMRYFGVPTDGVDPRAYAETFKRDTPEAREALEASGPVLHVAFENLVTLPLAAMRAVAQFIGWPLDIEAARKPLRPRQVSCLPYLLEEQLIAASPPSTDGPVKP